MFPCKSEIFFYLREDTGFFLLQNNRRDTVKKKVNKTTKIGIDTIEVTINQHIKIKETEIRSEKTGNRLGEIKPIKDGVKLSLNLPRFIYSDNIHPFGSMDARHLYNILEEISEVLQRLHLDLKAAKITSCEVNASAELKKPEHVQAIMQLFMLMFLEQSRSDKDKIYITIHGEDDCLYKNVPLEKKENILRKRLQVQSIKTPRLSNHRFSWKIYNKGLESDIKDKGILRIEQVHLPLSLKYAKVSDNLKDFLTCDNIIKLINLYKADFKVHFLDVFWNLDKTDDSFINRCIETICMELQEEQPLAAAKGHRDLIAIDFGLFRRACLRHYGKEHRKTALQAVRRVKQSGKIKVLEGTITELVKIFRAIIA